jgi:hypothetical protein
MKKLRIMAMLLSHSAGSGGRPTPPPCAFSSTIATQESPALIYFPTGSGTESRTVFTLDSDHAKQTTHPMNVQPRKIVMTVMGIKFGCRRFLAI